MTEIDPAIEQRRRRHRNERIAAVAVIVVVAIVAGIGVRWNRQEAGSLSRDRRYIPREVRITPAVTMLQELVRIDSSTVAGEAAAARWTAAALRRQGIQAEIIESAPSTLNVYARIPGRSPGNGLLLFSHLDVVPAGTGWTHRPFSAQVFGDQLIGRGTVDMKALTICQLLAFVDIARSGTRPEHDLVFLATADEETGSAHGMQWLVAHRPDIFAGIRYGITEGGITEMMTDRMTYFGIEIGGKQHVRARIAAPTRAAIEKARILLEPFIFSRTPGRVLPEVRTFFAQLAPTRLQFHSLLTDIDATIRQGQFWRLPPTYRDLLQNSVTTGAPAQSGNEWTMDVTLSNLPDEQPEARLAWLRQTIGPADAHIAEVTVRDGPVPMSSGHTPLFRILAEEAKERYDVDSGVQILYRSMSDARFLRPRGVDVYGICPYPITFYQSVAIHNANESIAIWAFQDGVEYVKSVVRRWARAA